MLNSAEHDFFSMLISMKMPTIVGIFIFISREISYSAMFSKKEFAIISNLRFISRTNFLLSLVEHEKKFYSLGAGSTAVMVEDDRIQSK